MGWCRLPVRLTRDSSVLPALPCDEIDVEKPDMTATLFNNADVVSREFAARPTKKNSIIYFKIVQIAPSCQGFFGVTAAGPTGPAADGMGQKWKEITMHFHIFAFAALHPGPMDDASNNFSRQNHQPLLASFGVVGWECQSSQVTRAHAGCKMGTPLFGVIFFRCLVLGEI